MPRLFISATSVQALESLLAQGSPSSGSSSSKASGPTLLPSELHAELTLALEAGKEQAAERFAEVQRREESDAKAMMNADSPADPDAMAGGKGKSKKQSKDAAQAGNEGQGLAVVQHKTLVKVSRWISDATQAQAIRERDTCTLSALLRGASLFHPLPPRFERSPELESRLAAIRLAHEEAEYERMTSGPLSSRPGLFSLAPTATRTPTRSDDVGGYSIGSGRLGGSVSLLDSGAKKLSPEEERREWNKVQRQLSALVNCVLSIAGVATAAWWASGNADPIWKVLSTLSACAIVAFAEAFLYVRSFQRADAAEEAAKARKRPVALTSRDPPARSRN